MTLTAVPWFLIAALANDPLASGAATPTADRAEIATVDDQRLALEVMAEINFARADPAAYAEILRAYRRQFRGDLVIRPSEVTIQTREGVAAVDEAISFLTRQSPLSPVRHDPLLDQAAQDLVIDQGPAGGFGHWGSDGSTFADRYVRRGGEPYGAEAISYGYDTAREVVIQLIVDDGVPGRGHRATLFSPRYGRMGVGCGPHAIYGHMCVIDYGF